MRALVAGAGFVGSALAAELAGAGHHVVALRRSEAPMVPGVTPIRVDLCDPSSLARLSGEFDVVFFTAAADESTDAAYLKTYVDGLTNLLRAPALVARPPGRVLFTSSTGVYGQTDGSWVDESSATDPTTFSGKRMLEAEARLGELAARPISLRCSGIYGPGRGRLIERIRRAEVRYAPGRYTNRIHRDDVARALVHLATVAHPQPVYVGSDRDPAEQRVVYEWLADRVGAPAPRRAADDAMMGRGTNKRCRGNALLRTGFELSYPTFREGYGAMLFDNPAP
jgi:nucleoside-diphosphate-sugar epimerase